MPPYSAAPSPDTRSNKKRIEDIGTVQSPVVFFL